MVRVSFPRELSAPTAFNRSLDKFKLITVIQQSPTHGHIQYFAAYLTFILLPGVHYKKRLIQQDRYKSREKLTVLDGGWPCTVSTM